MGSAFNKKEEEEKIEGDLKDDLKGEHTSEILWQIRRRRDFWECRDI